MCQDVTEHKLVHCVYLSVFCFSSAYCWSSDSWLKASLCFGSFDVMLIGFIAELGMKSNAETLSNAFV